MENIRADWESRHMKDASDWKLDRQVFLEVEERMGPFSIDMFASRTNAQLPAYCSWRADPAALAVDGLSIPWKEHHPYMFPPFALISRCLDKLRREEASAVMIAPVWPNQTWFPQVLDSLSDYPVLLPPLTEIVSSPTGQCHPMAIEGRLPLAAWPVSGELTSLEAFRSELLTSYRNLGENLQNQPILMPGNDGIAGVWKGAVIPFQLL